MLGLIVARSRNNVIGKDGKLPWNLPNELEQFKKLTTNNVVIMGRKTYEAIGHPLVNRLNIVVSKTSYDGPNLQSASSLTEAIKLAGNRDTYIGGGAKLYAEALPLVDVMYITEIALDVEGDTFFPEFDESLFEKQLLEEGNDGVKYRRFAYFRKKK